MKKTKVIILGRSKTRNSIACYLDNLTPYVKLHAKKIGFIFDSELKSKLAQLVKTATIN